MDFVFMGTYSRRRFHVISEHSKTQVHLVRKFSKLNLVRFLPCDETQQ